MAEIARHGDNRPSDNVVQTLASVFNTSAKRSMSSPLCRACINACVQFAVFSHAGIQAYRRQAVPLPG